MRLVKVSVPRGRGADVARIAFEHGIADVALQHVNRHQANTEPEPRDAVDVKVATPRATAFIDAVIAAPFFDSDSCAIEVREPRSILSSTSMREITRPVPAPMTDIDEELWQFTHVTYSFVLRVFISALLLSYGMIHDNPLILIGGLLFLPFTPLVLAFGFGVLTRQWQLMGHAVFALAVAVLLILAGGAAVALFADAPIMFDKFPPMIAGLVLSFAIGLASSIATADDVGRRELIGLAAASQLGLIPAWLGVSLVFGFDEAPAEKLQAFGVNLIALIVGTLAIYGYLFSRGALSHSSALNKGKRDS